MATLTVQFRGVCTHFWNNAIHGIPHRVVLPDAAPMRAGLLSFTSVPDPTQSFSYFLLPHFPLISLDGQTFNQSGIVDDGLLMKGAHLRIVNAKDNGLSYDDSFSQNVQPLTNFLADYSPSADVITGARTSAYFDIFTGSISAFPDGPPDAPSIRVQAVIETDGPPVLRVTPMSPDELTVPTVAFTLESPLPELSTLLIGNVSPFCLDGCDFDFLAHYLTHVSGIPRALTLPAPGMPGWPGPGAGTGNSPDPVEALIKLIELGYPGKLKFQDLFETSASCSDSRYP